MAGLNLTALLLELSSDAREAAQYPERNKKQIGGDIYKERTVICFV